MNLIRGLKAGEHLILDGRQPNPISLERVARASVGLSPLLDLSNYRHFQPTKILEYLVWGVPVVASDLPGTRSLVEGLEGVFVVRPGDSGALAEAIGRRCSRRSERRHRHR